MLNSNIDYDELKNFLAQRINVPFDGFYSRFYYDGCEDEDWYQDFSFECEADSYAYGCSKMVLFYREFPNIVVKIPFKGEYYEDDYWNDFYNSNMFFPIDAENDYCAAEAYVYSEACKCGIEKMFAETRYLFSIDGTPIYISEKVPNESWNYTWKDKMSSMTIASQLYNKSTKDCRFSEDSVGLFVDCYSTDDVELLLMFIEDYKIKDLHRGNIGFTKTGKVKLLDYSGFDSQELI